MFQCCQMEINQSMICAITHGYLMLYPNHGAMDGFKPKLRLRQKWRIDALLQFRGMGASTHGAMHTLFQIRKLGSLCPHMVSK